MLHRALEKAAHSAVFNGEFCVCRLDPVGGGVSLCIHDDFLLSFYQWLIERFQSPSCNYGAISFLSFSSFCFMYFEVLLLGAYTLRITMSSL